MLRFVVLASTAFMIAACRTDASPTPEATAAPAATSTPDVERAIYLDWVADRLEASGAAAESLANLASQTIARPVLLLDEGHKQRMMEAIDALALESKTVREFVDVPASGLLVQADMRNLALMQDEAVKWMSRGLESGNTEQFKSGLDFLEQAAMVAKQVPVTMQEELDTPIK